DARNGGRSRRNRLLARRAVAGEVVYRPPGCRVGRRAICPAVEPVLSRGDGPRRHGGGPGGGENDAKPHDCLLSWRLTRRKRTGLPRADRFESTSRANTRTERSAMAARHRRLSVVPARLLETIVPVRRTFRFRKLRRA